MAMPNFPFPVFIMTTSHNLQKMFGSKLLFKLLTFGSILGLEIVERFFP